MELNDQEKLYALRCIGAYGGKGSPTPDTIGIAQRALDVLVGEGLLKTNYKRKRYAMTPIGRHWLEEHGGPFTTMGGELHLYHNAMFDLELK